MSPVWTITALTCIPLFVIVIFIKNREIDRLKKIPGLKDLIQNHSDPHEKIQLFLELEKIENEKISWYEKSASIIGVVAFIAMLVTTGMQTTELSSKQSDIDSLEWKAEQSKQTIREAETILEGFNEGVIEIHLRTGAIDPKIEKILKSQVNWLKNSNPSDTSSLKRLFRMAILSKEFETALSLYRDHREIFSPTNILDQLAIAEYLFAAGDKWASKDMADSIDFIGKKDQKGALIRHAALMCLLTDSNEPYTLRLAEALNIEPIQASDKIRKAKINLNDFRKTMFSMETKTPEN